MSSSPDQEARRWLSAAVATRDLERLTPNMAAAGDRINDARRHIRSARTIANDLAPRAKYRPAPPPKR